MTTEPTIREGILGEPCAKTAPCTAIEVALLTIGRIIARYGTATTTTREVTKKSALHFKGRL